MAKFSISPSLRGLLHSTSHLHLSPNPCAVPRLSPLARRRIRSQLSFSFGNHLIPHPGKVDKGGEDAFFVSDHNGGVVAVADGVSGWAEQDVDPALFSQELMANAWKLVEDEEVNYNPQVLMRKAHAATSSVGSATVIIAMLEKNGILKVANLGDCGLRLIRRGQVVFATSPQEHCFDCPYQLSSEAVGQTYQDAMVFTADLIEGDTIVVGSDGLFDNIFDREIISIVSESQDVTEAGLFTIRRCSNFILNLCLLMDTVLSILARKLAHLASDHSKDVNFDSPYSMEARSRGFDVPWWKKILGGKLIGGKLDDVTVIVGRVISLPDSEKVMLETS